MKLESNFSLFFVYCCVSMKFDLYNHDNFWNVVSGATISWGACYCVSQTQVQRYLSMKSQKEAKKYSKS